MAERKAPVPNPNAGELVIRAAPDSLEAGLHRSLSLTRTVRAIGQAMLSNKGATVSGAVMAILIICALFAPVLAPHDPLEQDPKIRLTPPVWMDGGTWDHILGTDGNGRDLLSRILYGLRISLALSTVAVLIALCLGMVIGLTAGYLGGTVDALLMRLVDVQLGFPYVVSVSYTHLTLPTKA